MNQLGYSNSKTEQKHQCKILDIIIPCFNEEEVIVETLEVLSAVIQDIKRTELAFDYAFRLVIVDDVSTNDTIRAIKNAFGRISLEIHLLELGANSGQQSALIAGLEYSAETADILITIDADLQDDVASLIDMIRKYELGYQVVLGVRGDRSSDSLKKRLTAQIYYWIIGKVLRVRTIYNHGDFRLISKDIAIEALRYKESSLYLRGIIPMIDKNFATVHYSRSKRLHGKTKYNLFKSSSLALMAICSLSAAPLRIISLMGGLFSLVSIFVIFVILLSWLSGITVPGWASIISSVFLIGSIQLLALGIIGEYISRIFSETKNRPRYYLKNILVHRPT